jgi:hypothetical protein
MHHHGSPSRSSSFGVGAVTLPQRLPCWAQVPEHQDGARAPEHSMWTKASRSPIRAIEPGPLHQKNNEERNPLAQAQRRGRNEAPGNRRDKKKT